MTQDAAVRAQHDLGVEHGDERFEIPIARGSEERIHHLALTREVGVWDGPGSLYSPARAAGELARRRRRAVNDRGDLVERFDAYNVERLRTADTLLLGRKTYDLFKGFWPSVADNPEASAHQHDISRLDDAIDKIVVSDSITHDETDPSRETTRIVRRADAHDQLAKLKNRAGDGDILVFGSNTLWNKLLSAGLVDELHLMVGAVIVGEGMPAFADGLAGRLELTGTRTGNESDNVLLQYAVRAS